MTTSVAGAWVVASDCHASANQRQDNHRTGHQQTKKNFGNNFPKTKTENNQALVLVSSSQVNQP
jgi:hypothetical protein